MFTIAIPTYNRAKLLQRCLDSVKKQSFDEYECWILDDCSKDNTQEIIKPYLKDPRFKYRRFEKNLGFGDKCYQKAIDEKLFLGEYILFMCDDEYLYSPTHLEKCAELIGLHQDINFIGVDTGYDYAGIPIFQSNYNASLPQKFRIHDLSPIDRGILDDKFKTLYKYSFLVEHMFFDAKSQQKADVCFEVSYDEIYKKALMGYVPSVAHVFGVMPNARRKYLDFYNWIVSNGMVADRSNKERFYAKLASSFSDSALCLNAFFDWGAKDLAKCLTYFCDDENYPMLLRSFASLYKERFQKKLLSFYADFNAALLSLSEREALLESSKRIVLYGENSWRTQIENYLLKNNKEILFVADDFKEGYQSSFDILMRQEEIDCVFITSGSPKVIYQITKRLSALNNPKKIASLLLRDEEWQK